MKRTRRLGRLLFALSLSCVFAAENPNPEALARARRSYELARGGQLDQAVQEMREAIRLEPGNPLFLSALGGILSQQGKTRESRDAFAAAVRLAPANPVFRLHLAARQRELREFEDAREHAVHAASAELPPPGAKELLEAISLEWGAALARERRYQAGLALAQDTAKRFPQSSAVYEMLGLFQTKNQLNVPAVASYRRALELDSSSAGASVGLGIAAAAAGQAEEARAAFESGIRRFPADAMHHQAYGVFLLRLAETGAASKEEALTHLRRALELNPALAEAHYQLGNQALLDGDAESAARHLELAAKNGEDGSRLHFALARAYRRLGRSEEAARAMSRFQAHKAEEERQAPKP